MGQPLKHFSGLEVWQVGHEIVLEIYKITRVYPKEEVFVLVSQMRRAAVSITSNIAEGFSRKSYKEKLQFYYMAAGSLSELENQLLISKDMDYLPIEVFNKISNLIVREGMLLQAIIRRTKTFC